MVKSRHLNYWTTICLANLIISKISVVLNRHQEAKNRAYLQHHFKTSGKNMHKRKRISTRNWRRITNTYPRPSEKPARRVLDQAWRKMRMSAGRRSWSSAATVSKRSCWTKKLKKSRKWKYSKLQGNHCGKVILLQGSTWILSQPNNSRKLVKTARRELSTPFRK